MKFYRWTSLFEKMQLMPNYNHTIEHEIKIVFLSTVELRTCSNSLLESWSSSITAEAWFMGLLSILNKLADTLPNSSVAMV